MVKEILAYATDDGKIFIDKNQAEKYEKDKKISDGAERIKSLVERELKTHAPTDYDAEGIIEYSVYGFEDFLVDNRKTIIELLGGVINE